MKHEDFRREIKISRDNAHRMLFDEYSSYVYTIIYNRLRSIAKREDLEECMSDIFAEIFLAYDTEKEFCGEIKGFIGTVAKRIASDYYNRINSHKTDNISIDDELTDKFVSDERVDETVYSRDIQNILLDMIKSLGEPDSVILIQKFYFKRNSTFISKQVGLTPENVRARCRRALKKLRAMLEKAGIEL